MKETLSINLRGVNKGGGAGGVIALPNFGRIEDAPVKSTTKNVLLSLDRHWIEIRAIYKYWFWVPKCSMNWPNLLRPGEKMLKKLAWLNPLTGMMLKWKNVMTILLQIWSKTRLKKVRDREHMTFFGISSEFLLNFYYFFYFFYNFLVL